MEPALRALAARILREGHVDVTGPGGVVRRATPTGVYVLFQGQPELVRGVPDAFEAARAMYFWCEF